MHAHVPSFRRLRWVAAVVLLGAGLALVPGQSVAVADSEKAREPTQFACPPDVSSPFTDIAGSEHELAISCMYEFGIAFGVDEDTFEPDTGSTRAETAASIVNAVEYAGFVAPEDPGP